MRRGVMVAAVAMVIALSARGCHPSSETCLGPTVTISPTALLEGDTVQVSVTNAWQTCDWRGHGVEPQEGPVVITVMNAEATSIAATVGVLIDENGGGSATLDTSDLAPGTYPVFTGLAGIPELGDPDSPFAELTVAAG